MKLTYLKLENFQGIKSLEITSDGTDIEVRGDNATGKTTIGNAITWLLYDKPLGGEKNFSPKTLKSDGSEVHNLTHAVEAVFRDNSGDLNIRKELKEIWTKKRGTAKDTFTGHTTDYYINTIPVKAGEFAKRIEQICDPEKAKILTSPFYFPVDLKWTDRRELLLSVCGDITDKQVIASSTELSPLRDVINGENGTKYTIDDYLKIAKSQMVKINETIKSIPSRIDEAEKARPSVEDIYPKVFEREIAEHEDDIAELQKQKLNLENGKVDESLLEKKKEINNRIIQKSTEYANLQNKENTQQADALIESASLVKNAEITFANQRKKVLEIEATIEIKREQQIKLSEKYHEIASQQWEGETVCPTCGQELPPEKIEEVKAAFNLSKSKRLELINKDGSENCSKAILEKLAVNLKLNETILAKASEELKELQQAHQAALELVKETVPFSETTRGKQLQSELDEISKQINEPDKDIAPQISKLNVEINGIKANVTVLEDKLSDYRIAEKQELRIAELKLQEENLSAEYEKLEANIYLCEQFIKTKVSMLTESINNRFKNVRFKLFEDQINGGLKECCEVLVPCKEGLIPFSTANNAGKINAGIEIIDALSKHWGVEMPLIVDNAESVTQLLDTDLQVIKLIVDEKYKELQINGGMEEWQKTA
ncbi:AAA family ATPase [Acetobacterium paludosum]|uniref:AAA family ATPase n=1 Tax=Acetobacterium paludosum TaxID=52693 RepID=A0A923HXL8_9FIRM|nr:AAA family ATPase [Acetobacterium paludosum]MBC3889472.1 AAA family ATPase [Acetobacterium paludosum]